MNTYLSKAAAQQDTFRPMPFWSWNEELKPERLRHQIREMHRAGLGGFFMHARVGLKTPYMGDEWFACVKACIDEAKKCGMQAWGYDENGYPSGIADGKVCRESEDYRSTWIELWPEHTDAAAKGRRVLARYRRAENGWERLSIDGQETDAHVLILKNETRAADPLNPQAVRRFLELTHERYRAELGADLGTGMPGFFTDEPQLKQYQLPWTKDLDVLFSKTYGYDLLDHAPALKDDSVTEHEAVRNDYWMLIDRLYAESFARVVQEWCRKNGCRFTGHIMAEDTILEQMGSNGGAMPFYEYMDIPGMDWLGRRIGTPLAPKQVSSVAAQMGRKQVLSETFALSGWDVSFEDLKWMAEWQYANGVNLLCPHLESYSIRGIRKRDYPASLFVQEPWWGQFSQFTDYISALGTTLAHARETASVLVVHPLHTAHIRYNGGFDCAAVRRLDETFAETLAALQEQHIGYALGDEVLMGKYGAVTGDRIVVGAMQYTCVLLPDMENILSTTVGLLEKLLAAGGCVYTTGQIPLFVDGRPSDRVQRLQLQTVDKAAFKAVLDVHGRLSVRENGCEAADILTAARENGETRLYFLVNSSRNTAHTVTVTLRGEKTAAAVELPSFATVDCGATANGADVQLTVTLQPAQSVLLINERGETAMPKTPLREITLPKACRIREKDHNALTLDACSWSLDGGEWQPEMPLIRLQKTLLDKQTDAPLRLRFRFENGMSAVPRELYLVSENIPEFSLSVNGHAVPIKETDTDWFLDPDFRRVNIAPYTVAGENVIELSGRFWQRRVLYEYLYREKDLSSNFYDVDFEFEGVTYDTELESLYLLGDFTVESRTPYRAGARRTYFTDGPFVLRDDTETLTDGNITTGGFPFFAGRMELEWQVSLQKETGVRYTLAGGKPICPTATVSVNGSPALSLSFAPCTPDLTPYLHDGENTVTMQLYAGLRNLLGPHHFKFGESYYVGTTTFGDTPGWCESVEGIHEPLWSDGWSFVRFGPAE